MSSDRGRRESSILLFDNEFFSYMLLLKTWESCAFFYNFRFIISCKCFFTPVGIYGNPLFDLEGIRDLHPDSRSVSRGRSFSHVFQTTAVNIHTYKLDRTYSLGQRVKKKTITFVLAKAGNGAWEVEIPMSAIANLEQNPKVGYSGRGFANRVINSILDTLFEAGGTKMTKHWLYVSQEFSKLRLTFLLAATYSHL